MKRSRLLIAVRCTAVILASLPILASAASGSAGPCMPNLPLAQSDPLSSLPADDEILMHFNLADNVCPPGPPSSKGTPA